MVESWKGEMVETPLPRTTRCHIGSSGSSAELGEGYRTRTIFTSLQVKGARVLFAYGSLRLLGGIGVGVDTLMAERYLR